jgi:hypothetical protein
MLRFEPSVSTEETMAKSRVAKITAADAALGEIRKALANDKSARTRALRVKLEMYERVLRGWHGRTPGEEQYRSLFDCVLELHEEVFGKQEGRAWGVEQPPSEPPESRPSVRPTAPAPLSALKKDTEK